MRAPSTLLLLLLVVLLPGLAAADDSPPAKKPRMVSLMPNVVGKTQSEAQRHLRAANVAVKIVEEASSQVGRVLSQKPVGGTRVDPGALAVIHIGVAADVPTVVPRLVGRDIDEIRKRYLAIYVIEIVAADPNTGRPGIVLKQHPEPGIKHPYRGRVRIELVPRPSVVPDVVGKNVDVAHGILEQAGYRVEVRREERAGILPGAVLSQVPAAGVSAHVASTVRLVVSGGSARVVPIREQQPRPGELRAPPNVLGLSFHDAHMWLKTTGFEPRSSFVRVDHKESLQVIQQDPVTRDPIPLGSAVRLTVTRRAEPPKDLSVPILLGHLREDATLVLEGLGYRPRFVARPSPLPRGTVLEQLPSPGRPAAQGSDLVLYVADPPPPNWSPRQLKIPDLTNRRLTEVLVLLFRMNYPVRFRAVPTRGMPMDVVVGQEPAAGTELSMGRPVTVHMPERVRVPNVVGLDATQAQAALHAAGLVSAPVRGTGSFVVLQQTPAAGRVVARGLAMRLQVAPRDAHVVVPDVRGLPPAQAQELLKPLGLKLRQVDVASGRIRTQEPAPLERVARGSTVTVRVGP